MIATAQNKPRQKNIAEFLWTNKDRRDVINLRSQVCDTKKNTHEITEAFLNSVAEPNPARRSQRMEHRLDKIEEGWSARRFSASTDFDYDMFFNSIWGDKRLKAATGMDISKQEMKNMLIGEGAGYGSNSVQESLVDALTSGHVSDMLTTLFRFNMIEKVEHAPLTLTGLVDTNLRRGAAPERWYKQVNPADVVTDNVGELEVTQLQGVTKQPYVSPPDPTTKEIAFAITKELGTADVGSVIRQQVDNHSVALDLHMEILLADLLFGLYDTGTPGANPFPYVVNGTELHPYQIVGAGAWTNDLQPNALDNTYQPFANIGAVLEDARDPYSTLPLNNTQNGALVTTTEQARQQAQDGLRIIDIERSGASLGANTITFRNISQSTRFNLEVGNIIKADYARDRLTAWYQTTAGGGLAAGPAKTAAASTWLYGNFERAAGVATQWDRETIQRVNPDEQYFFQRVIYMVKWMERTTPMWKDPERMFRNRA